MSTNPEIRDLGQDTFLVGRRVIKARVPGMFDPSKQEGRDELARIASNMFTGKFSKAPWGELTAYALRPAHPQFLARFPDAKYEGDVLHFAYLHEGAKEILREEFPEYTGRI